jgi:PAS domain S-box-containing protein
MTWSTWRATALRTVVPALLTLGLFVAMVFIIALPAFEKHLISTQRETARNLVETAITLLASYDRQVGDGELTRDEAQARAMERLRTLRYGPEGRDYFWINDLQPVVLMHPYMNEIEGSDIFYIPDAEGRPLLLAFLEIVRSPEQGGFCYYQWQDREQRTEPEDKVSYVELYEPWGWIVGTGVYLDDVKTAVARMTRTLTSASLLILLAITILALFVVFTSVRREILRLSAEQAVREREQTMQAVLDNTVQFMGLLSPEGRVLHVNRTALSFIDAEEQEIQGALFWDTPWWAHSTALQATLRNIVEACAKERRRISHSATNSAPDGTMIDIDFSLSPILDEQGRVTQIVAEGRDVTAINRANQALRKSEEELATILDSIQDGVVAVDAEGRILRLNPVAERLVGDAGSGCVGRLLDESLHLLDPAGRPIADLCSRCLHTEKTRQPLQARLEDAAGELSTVEITAATIPGPDGSPAGGVIVLRDRTEEILLRQQLDQAQKLEAIGQLAGGVAHDFNNLLTGILGNAQLLHERSAAGSPEGQPTREIIDAATRAADLTRQLLAFSRKGKFQNAPVDTHDLVAQVSGLLARSIDKRIQLQSDFAADRPFVEGDSTQLYNALLNLGLNARDAMPEGGTLRIGTHNVTLAASDPRLRGTDHSPGDYLALTVADTGIGMDEETRRRIFEPFFTTKPLGQGTGLGLAGVYGCVVNHDGLIEVVSTPAEGSVFTILLPVSAQPAPVVEAPRPLTADGEGRILVIEDEEAVRTFAGRALERFGYEAILCADGIEATAYYQEHADEVDLVILDLIMPRLSGEETFARLRQISEDVPILIASGFSQDQAVTDLIQQGAAGFLAKPYPLEQLSQTVGRHMRRPEPARLSRSPG